MTKGRRRRAGPGPQGGRGPTASLEQVPGTAWRNDDWQAFATYDFKPWLLRGLSDEGAAKVRATRAWDGNNPGNAEWAVKWHDAKEDGDPARPDRRRPYGPQRQPRQAARPRRRGPVDRDGHQRPRFGPGPGQPRGREHGPGDRRLLRRAEQPGRLRQRVRAPPWTT